MGNSKKALQRATVPQRRELRLEYSQRRELEILEHAEQERVRELRYAYCTCIVGELQV